MSAIKRGIGKLGQRTGELLGIDSGSKIEVSEEFKDLLFETDHRHSGTENVHAALQLYSSQMLKKKDASDNSKLKLYLLENLGASMVRLGTGLPKDSPYGRAMREVGQAEERMSEQQVEFVNTAREGWMPSLQRSLDDFKEYVALQKKLESRRSEYDSKLVKFQKARKDNMTVEDELRTAQVRYEDAYDDLAHRMLDMQDQETECLREAYNFYQAQLAYHQKCVAEMTRLGGIFDECLRAKRAPAAERHPLGRALDSRRAALTKKSSDTPTSSRQPIPFGANMSSASLSRSTTQSTGRRHFRNGSQQFSDISDEMDSGAYDSGTQEPRKQAPQFSRVQSDSGPALPGRQGVPTVAPRRHAPAPPTPSRGPRRALKRSIYKFHANELGELPMEKGDIVEVTERIDDGWLKGKLVYSVAAGQIGASGLFPANYTEECNESDIPPISSASGGSGGGTIHQRSASLAAAATVKPCVCGCDDFVANKFQEGKCRTCFHHH